MSPIAGGGAATVWRAIDTRLGREVAVKIVSANEHERHRLEREARAVASLDHPAILPVHDVAADGASTAIVMPLVRGESLATRLAREGRLPEDIAVMIVGPIASALAHAHVRGVIHCDVKPGNSCSIPRVGRDWPTSASPDHATTTWSDTRPESSKGPCSRWRPSG